MPWERISQEPCVELDLFLAKQKLKKEVGSLLKEQSMDCNTTTTSVSFEVFPC